MAATGGVSLWVGGSAAALLAGGSKPVAGNPTRSLDHFRRGGGFQLGGGVALALDRTGDSSARRAGLSDQVQGLAPR